MKEIQRIAWVTNWRPPGTGNFPNYLYYEGNDIHVLRNSTQQSPKSTGSLIANLVVFLKDTANNNAISAVLLSDLTLGIVAGTNYQVNSIRCVPDLKGAASAFSNAPNNSWSIEDVSFNFRTGQISATQLTNPGGNEIKNFNFLLSIQIKNSNNITFETFTRVHIHNDITRAWLTPSTLNIVKDENNCRLSIYAEFSSGVVADISNHPGITWASGTSTNVSVTTPGYLTGSIVNGSSVITASISPALNNLAGNLQITSAIVTVDSSWQNPSVIDYVECIKGPGKNNPGVRNILFISEGYDAEADGIGNLFRGARKRFKKMTASLIKKIEKENSKEPYKSLFANNSVNIWRYYTPSGEKVCTLLSEVVETKYYHVQSIPIPGTKPVQFSITEQLVNTNVAKSVKDYIADSDNDLAGSGLHCLPWHPDLLINPNVSSLENLAHWNKYRKNSPANANRELTLGGLVRKVGLPTPADKNLTISQLKTKWHNLYDPNLICYDSDLSDTNPGTVHVREITFKFWRLLAERRMLDERNTRFGISMGDKPRAYPLTPADYEDSYYFYDFGANMVTGDLDSKGFNYNRRRTSRKNIDNLLLNLRDLKDSTMQNPPAIGAQWSDNGTRGLDYDLVIFLCHAPHYGGTRIPGNNNIQQSAGVCCSLEDQRYFTYTVVTNSGNRRKIDDSAYPNPLRPNNNTKQTFLHEISHALTLGDEYGGKQANLPQGYAAGMRNLQAEVSLLDQNGNLDAQKINWRWLRIETAGVLTNIQGPDGNGKHTLTLRPGHTLNFEKNQTIYLRKKDLPNIDPNSQTPSADFNGPITIYDIVGETLLVTNLANAPGTPTDWIVVKLNELTFDGQGAVKVVGQGVTGSGTYFLTQLKPGSKINVGGQIGEVQTITNHTALTLTSGSAFSTAVTDFTKFTCRPPALEKFSELISHTVRKVITANNATMTTYPCLVNNDGVQDQQPEISQLAVGSTNYFHLSHGVENYNQIVGLYANGAEYNCGVFHPTGTCMMRNVTDNIDPETGEYTTHSFCPVCRYVLVDKLDPSLHKIMFDAYNLNYPKI
jgi:hypothetical protein